MAYMRGIAQREGICSGPCCSSAAANHRCPLNMNLARVRATYHFSALRTSSAFMWASDCVPLVVKLTSNRDFGPDGGFDCMRDRGRRVLRWCAGADRGVQGPSRQAAHDGHRGVPVAARVRLRTRRPPGRRLPAGGLFPPCPHVDPFPPPLLRLCAHMRPRAPGPGQVCRLAWATCARCRVDDGAAAPSGALIGHGTVQQGSYPFIQVHARRAA